MANKDDFGKGESPWGGSPPGGEPHGLPPPLKSSLLAMPMYIMFLE